MLCPPSLDIAEMAVVPVLLRMRRCAPTFGLLTRQRGDEDHGGMLVDDVRRDDQGRTFAGLLRPFHGVKPNAHDVAAFEAGHRGHGALPPPMDDILAQSLSTHPPSRGSLQ